MNCLGLKPLGLPGVEPTSMHHVAFVTEVYEVVDPTLTVLASTEKRPSLADIEPPAGAESSLTHAESLSVIDPFTGVGVERRWCWPSEALMMATNSRLRPCPS